MNRIRALGIALVVSVGLPAWAQQTPYATDFEGGVTGWQLHGLWAIDGTPSSVPGGVASSGNRSLNFNNGVDYAGVSRGSCQSPSILAPNRGDHILRFRCNYQTETTGTRYDRRSVVIRRDGTVISDQVLSSLATAPNGYRCGAMTTWHQHEIVIPHYPLSTTYQVEFVFDSVDSYANQHAGWFVDDFSLQSVNAQIGQEFDLVAYTTRNFQQMAITTRVRHNGTVDILRTQPNALFAPLSGTATAQELLNLNQAIAAANLASLPATIPDPNVYIVAPTSFELNVISGNPNNNHTVAGSEGIFGQWDAQLRPVVDAIEAIRDRLLANGGGSSGDDHSNTAQGATVLDLGATATPGAIDPAGDVDWFEFQDGSPVIMIFPTPNRTYTVQTTVTGNMDTFIDLFAADGTTLLASNDDAGGGLASRIDYTVTHGTKLLVRVRHYSSTKTGSYAIRATAGASSPGTIPVIDDHGNTAAQGSIVAVGSTPTPGNIDNAGDVDFFAFTTATGGSAKKHVITANVLGSTDTVIQLIAANGTTVMATNDDAAGLGLGSKIEATLQPGTQFYVKVRHYSSTGTGAYTLSVATAP